MSYEYKDEIIMNLKDYNAGRKVTGGTNAFESKLSELDHVYTQATKADEYEAKAKAFDAILKAYDEAFSREQMAGEVSNIIEKYESGEPK